MSQLITKKSIMVTGGAGFIGGYVIKELLKKGYKVVAIDNLSKEDSRIPEGAEFIKADLRDKKNIISLFKRGEFCINIASKIGGIGYFHKYPATILSENNEIYSSTFEAAAINNYKRMVYISSSMVYESANEFPLKEQALKAIAPPVTGYGFSKLSGEYYCRMFFEQYGLDYTIIRPFNAYGINEFPGDYVGYAHVIPDITMKIMSGKYPIEILGNGEQSRCFTHVRDIARGIVMSLESPKAKNESFNLGSDEEIKIIEVAKRIWRILGQKKEFRAKFAEPLKDDIFRRVSDSSKAKKAFGWRPEINFEIGLKETVGWLKTLNFNSFGKLTLN